jgi:small subunit ribosomal protein S13
MDENKQDIKKPEIKAIIRILSTDLDGTKPVYKALRKIKGISFMFSNAICNHLGIDKAKKAGALSPQEVQRIEALIESPKELPVWLLNRRNDVETGESVHLTTAKLKLAKESDLKRMKKVKSYKGLRHAWALPVRGQRTKSHFRKGRKVGVVKKKIVQAKKPAAASAKK